MGRLTKGEKEKKLIKCKHKKLVETCLFKTDDSSAYIIHCKKCNKYIKSWGTSR